jgi:hypothetical protein
MTQGPLVIDWTALGTWALVAITGFAVYFGRKAANTANDTFRLEAEAKLVVRAAGQGKIFARQGLHRLSPDWNANAPLESSHFTELTEPVYLVEGKPGDDGRALILNGFRIRPPTPNELNQFSQVPVWPAIRVEIRNVGRSPAIQAGLKWRISALVFTAEWRQTLDRGGPDVEERVDEATIVIEGIGPNDSAFIWLANPIGTAFKLTLICPGYQRDPLDLESGKTKPLTMMAITSFALPSMQGESIS